MSNLSNFYVYDGEGARLGLVEGWTSVQWLEYFADAGEAKLVCPASDQNLGLLRRQRILYNTDSRTFATIQEVEISDDGLLPSMTVRAQLAVQQLEERVIETLPVLSAGVPCETYMRNLVFDNLRGLSLGLDLAENFSETAQAELERGSVLHGLKALSAASGLGFTVEFNPVSCGKTFKVVRGADRTAGEAYRGYFGDDVGNLADIQLSLSSAESANMAWVGGEGEENEQILVKVDLSGGGPLREIWVDAKSTKKKKDESDEEYRARLRQKGLDKLNGKKKDKELELSAKALDGGTLTYGVDYFLGDWMPIKLTRYGLRAKARVEGVTLTYEEAGRDVAPIFSTFEVI